MVTHHGRLPVGIAAASVFDAEMDFGIGHVGYWLGSNQSTPEGGASI